MSIHDTGWGQFLEILRHIADAGMVMIAVNPIGTIQPCSGCAALVPKPPSDRRHTCPHRGCSLYRGINAVRTIRARAGLSREVSPTRQSLGFSRGAFEYRQFLRWRRRLLSPGCPMDRTESAGNPPPSPRLRLFFPGATGATWPRGKATGKAGVTPCPPAPGRPPGEAKKGDSSFSRQKNPHRSPTACYANS